MISKGVQIVAIIQLCLHMTFSFSSPFELISKKAQNNLESRDANSVFNDLAVTINANNMGVAVTGFKMQTYENKEIYAYQGIRYAGKPKRFQPSEELKPDFYTQDNMTSYEAIHLPEKCAQHSVLNHSMASGTEDCLFLNVYTPQLPNLLGNYGNPLPVMIFIHGGGFMVGDTSFYMPTRLLDRDVLLVVIQYRLGSFGFFSTGDINARGNAGLYDQQLAMQWVNKYIADFGGDKDNVVIFGQSAGAASVTYHLLNPTSSQYFKGVIAESGTALESWASDSDPVTSCKDFTKFVGCDKITLNLTLNCMVDLDWKELAVGIAKFEQMERLNGKLGNRGVSPIIQDFLLDPANDNPIVSKKPEIALEQGDFSASLMLGTTRDEGSFFFGAMYTGYLVPNGYHTNGLYLQEQLIPDLLESLGYGDRTHALSESLADEYLRGVDRTDFDAITPGMIDMTGVLMEKGGSYEFAKMHSYYSGSLNKTTRTYYYSFDYLSDDSVFDWLFAGAETPPPFDGGVTHSDELIYLFSLPAEFDAAQVDVKNKMIELWANFGSDQNPTPLGQGEWVDLGIPRWTSLDVADPKFMLMSDSFAMEDDYLSRWNGRDESTTTPSPSSTISSSTVSGTSPSSTSPSSTSPSSTSPSSTSPSSTSPSSPVSGKPGSTISTSTTALPPGCVSANEYEALADEKDDVERTKDIYMGLMISFIILFVGAGAAAGYLFYKSRK